MGKVILGIHGLANKPPKETLKKWWKQSLDEGLRNVRGGGKVPRFRFEMVYWADRLYTQRLHDDKLYDFDALYNSEPYVKAEPGDLVVHKDSFFDDVRTAVLGAGGALIDRARRLGGDDEAADFLLGKTLKDLAFYYDPGRKLKGANGKPQVARKALDGVLREAIEAEQGHEIMVIAHSMGTITSYNVLRALGRAKNPPEISHYLTIGSPLGLPYVKKKIIDEHGYDPKVRTPSVVKKWVNLADPHDVVALDIKLRDDYEENSAGVRVKDDIVNNTYRIVKPGSKKPQNNHHKSYGYLRTPELSELVAGFLGI